MVKERVGKSESSQGRSLHAGESEEGLSYLQTVRIILYVASGKAASGEAGNIEKFKKIENYFVWL